MKKLDNVVFVEKERGAQGWLIVKPYDILIAFIEVGVVSWAVPEDDERERGQKKCDAAR